MRLILRMTPVLIAVVLAAACGDAASPTAVPVGTAPAAEATTSDLDGCVSDGLCVLPPIIVGGGGGGDECDPSTGRCEEPTPGECITSGTPDSDSLAGLDDCGGGGSLGGGGSTDPGDGGSESPPASEDVSTDTCYTGDPIVDTPTVQDGFNAIWTLSNYDPSGSQETRREQGGWILKDGQGYRFEQFPSTWNRTPCSIDFPPNLTPPSGAVGWVHTHPYRNGERMTECRQELPGGIQVAFTYRNDPSFDDDEITKAWRAMGYDIKGYVIDADQITVFTGEDAAETVNAYSRCG